ncbi:MAG: hypothetical protein GXO60_07175 [Epsilonproteobacteria bacterium]|nr:hypothetical protein [Campylobacterota bacterium]
MQPIYIFFASTISVGFILSVISAISIYIHKKKISVALIPLLIFPIILVLSVYLSRVTLSIYPSRLNILATIFISSPLIYGLYLYFFDKENYIKGLFFVFSLISLGFYYFATFYHPYSGYSLTNHYTNKYIEIDRIDCIGKIEKWLNNRNISLYESDEIEYNQSIEEIRRLRNKKIRVCDENYNEYIFDERCNFEKELKSEF